MKHTRKVDLPEGFLDDFRLSDASVIKTYLVLKELAEVKKENGKLENGMAWVYCSYEYAKREFKISKPTFRKSILLLSEMGWIAGFRRGNIGNTIRKRTSNEYLIPFEKNINESEHFKMLLWRKSEKQTPKTLDNLDNP